MLEQVSHVVLPCVVLFTLFTAWTTHIRGFNHQHDESDLSKDLQQCIDGVANILWSQSSTLHGSGFHALDKISVLIEPHMQAVLYKYGLRGAVWCATFQMHSFRGEATYWSVNYTDYLWNKLVCPYSNDHMPQSCSAPILFACGNKIKLSLHDDQTCLPYHMILKRECRNLRLDSDAAFTPQLCGFHWGMVWATGSPTYSPVSKMVSKAPAPSSFMDEIGLRHTYMDRSVCESIKRWSTNARSYRLHAKVQEMLVHMSGRDQGHAGILHALGMFLANRLLKGNQTSAASDELHSLMRNFVHVGVMHGFVWQILARGVASTGVPAPIWGARLCAPFVAKQGNPLLFLLYQCAHGVGHALTLLGRKPSECLHATLQRELGGGSWVYLKWKEFCSAGAMMQVETETAWTYH